VVNEPQPMALTDNDILRLDIEVSNAMLVKECDIFYKLIHKVCDRVAEVTEVEPDVKTVSFWKYNESSQFILK
jgi:hypothetical protein